MKNIRRTSQFTKDIKRIKKRRKKFDRFKEIIEKLVSDQKLEPKYRDHLLVEQYKGTRECHIEPDWHLIYALTKRELILIRTGSHSDLFK